MTTQHSLGAATLQSVAALMWKQNRPTGPLTTQEISHVQISFVRHGLGCDTAPDSSTPPHSGPSPLNTPFIPEAVADASFTISQELEQQEVNIFVFLLVYLL
jgi:hypothetical protein